MSQVATRASSFEEHLRDPDFRRGYDDYFRNGRECGRSANYDHGYRFAEYVDDSEGGRLPLTRRGIINPIAAARLVEAIKDGALEE